jgi:hypothetical protein
MLISMPTGTSTIFGAFQAIPALLREGTFVVLGLSYCGSESSPVKYFAPKLMLRCGMAFRFRQSQFKGKAYQVLRSEDEAGLYRRAGAGSLR